MNVEKEGLDALSEVMKKQGYYFANQHTVLKTCSWTRNALTQNRYCYKCKFYGIESHRCIQMSPAAFWCWNACIHCWRLRPQDAGINWNETKMPDFDEDISTLVDKIIEGQRRLLSGYKVHPKVDKTLFEEAMNPKHVAISLTGEPTLYNRLDELIREFHRRGLTTFLVTRGVRPDVILNLKEKPSQLYISMEAYSKEMYEWVNQPLVPNAWEMTMRTLEGLSDYGRPTVLRITLIKGINMDEKAVKGFSKLIEIMQPTYIEPKAYMYVGASMLRLSKDNMPTYEEVISFAEKLSKATGYPIRSSSKASRIALLSKLERPIRFGKGCPEGWSQAD
ncbi:MAG: 4-demethylwyosine synthase TYW1 [Fervidicoccaceae archaeon]